MEFTNYILEAAGVSDVDIMDIEVTQAMAEMAVLEAMMDCYEKQMVLLEYNYESAEEIFTEAETYVPEMPEEYVVEFKKIDVQRDGATGKWQVVQYEAENQKFKDDKGWTHTNAVRKYGVNTPGVEPDKILGTYDTEKEAQDAYEKFNLDLFGKQSKTRIDREKRAQLPHEKTPRGTIDTRKENPERTERKLAEKRKKLEKAAGTPVTSTTSTTPSESPKQADQWDGSANVSTASKSFGNSFKKFMSKAGSVIQQLVLGLVDAIFEVNFEKLKEKVLDKGADFEVKINKNEFDKLNRLAALIKVTENYYEECSLDKLKNVIWTKAKVGAYIDTVKDFEKALREKFELVNAENENDEGYAMNKDDFALLCDKLGHGEFKKLLRKCQKEVSAANIDYNVENQIPPAVGKELRKFVNYLIKAYRDTSKCFTKVLKFAADVGAKAMKRGENSGVDYGTAKNAKSLERRQKMSEKFHKIGNFSGKVNDRIAAARAQKEAEAEGWAEEGWSMDLSEDEDFF